MGCFSVRECGGSSVVLQERFISIHSIFCRCPLRLFDTRGRGGAAISALHGCAYGR